MILCKLIIVNEFNFGANLIIRSTLNHWDQSITVGSNQDFKYDHLDISLIFSNISPIFYRKFD